MKVVRRLVVSDNGDNASRDDGQDDEIGDPVEVIPIAFEIGYSSGGDLIDFHLNVLAFFRPTGMTVLQIAVHFSNSPFFPSLVLASRFSDLKRTKNFGHKTCI